MLLTIDIGNTMVTLGVFDGERLAPTLRLTSDTRRLPDEYGLLITHLLTLNGVESFQIHDICLCSVVPPLTVVFEELCTSYFGVKSLTVSAGVRTGLQITYDNPRDVGSDRIADAVAAIELYGQPVIVVDFGTATVFDAISRDGVYLGGAIAPGLRMSAESLFANTSQLRRVDLLVPKTAIGKNTTHAMQSGLVLGNVDLIEGMVKRFQRELGQNAKVIGTGGLVSLIASETQMFDAVNLDLILLGLRMIYEMNMESGQPETEHEDRH